MSDNQQTDADIIPPSPNREENLAKGVDEMVPDPDDIPGGTNPNGSLRPDLEQADAEDLPTENIPEDANISHTPTSEDTIALKSPAVQGTESVSGSDADPASGDDMLEEVHAVGEQNGEDLEHPKEIDLGRDINNAEQEILES